MVTDRISDRERIITEQEQREQQDSHLVTDTTPQLGGNLDLNTFTVHEGRELRWQNRQLRKTCGRQGQTIHMLRAELAEVRALNSKLERGELRRQERVIEEQAETIARLKRKIKVSEREHNS